jgi:glycosyltransferase involved in cell wall biosynthesis
MLKGEDIICISWLVWDSIPLVMHQMMTRLAKHNRVLFVDPPVAYSNLAIKPSLLKNHFKKTLLWIRGVKKAKENLYIYYPPPLLMQYGHAKIADNFNQALTAFAIKKAADSLEFKNPILWIYHPYAINPKGQFNEKLACYDCNDDVGFFFTTHFDKRKRLSAMETDLTKKSDIVFTTSKYLLQLRIAQNPNTYYLPSGVDFENFRKALAPELKIPPEIEELPKPIIGFVGGMANSKMNWQWINEAALAHPKWNFVFVGPCVETPPSYIVEKKNIKFVEAKPQEILPAYIKGFDVCLIPYQGEDFLKACQPTKAFEYLAAGKPVVSSWIPELEDYKEIIHLSRDVNEFMQNIKVALKDGGKGEMVKLYAQPTQGYTWEDRVEKASEFIEKILKSRV